MTVEVLLALSALAPDDMTKETETINAILESKLSNYTFIKLQMMHLIKYEYEIHLVKLYLNLNTI